jgi:hypothetical protein
MAVLVARRVMRRVGFFCGINQIGRVLNDGSIQWRAVSLTDLESSSLTEFAKHR